MKLESSSFKHREPIPAEFAFGKPGADGAPMQWSDNRNPALNWREAPAATRSFVLIMVDPDVPSVFDDVNKAGRQIAAELPRQEFYHWVMIDIPATLDAIEGGSVSSAVTKGGKPNPPGPAGARQGLNDYGGFMGDGDYFGYDGPCPPWNDALLHRYFLRLFALDVARVDLCQRFTGPEVLRAIQGHVLDETAIYGTYSLNPALRG